jgi:hypothetical protein
VYDVMQAPRDAEVGDVRLGACDELHLGRRRGRSACHTRRSAAEAFEPLDFKLDDYPTGLLTSSPETRMSQRRSRRRRCVRCGNHNFDALAAHTAACQQNLLQ